MKKIIVVIVTYNGIKWYDKCFNSLRKSTIPLQIIVIDNNSSDNSVEYIKENFPEIRLIDNDENLGFGKANNIGFKYAIQEDADFVFLLNQDAWVMPDTIEKLIIQMEDHPEFGILSPIHLNGKGDNLDINFSYWLLVGNCENLVSDTLVYGQPKDEIYQIKSINAALWLISKNCLKSIGGFDPLFPHYGEDDNYVQRLRFHGFNVGIYPLVKGFHDRVSGIQSDSFSKRKKARYVKMLIILLNVNFSFITCIKKFVKSSTLSIFENLLNFSGKGIIIELILLFRVFYSLPCLQKHHKLSKIKGITFLN